VTYSYRSHYGPGG